ncbi:MAG: hypothetical protein AAB254_00330 [candidate division NC10 bacterium]
MTNQRDEQEILQTERRRFEAMVRGDLAAQFFDFQDWVVMLV